MDNEAFFEKNIQTFLQRNVVLEVNGKKYRRGKLKNFKVMDLYYQLDLLVDGSPRKVELPIPFKMRMNGGDFEMSYKMSDMGEYGLQLDKKVKKEFGFGRSKLYNSILVIKES